jgi:alkylation response protein AidB-like acyl-CoA dehydrogenase
MGLELPPDAQAFIASLDKLINEKIYPLQNANDNQRFFDHRREHSRTQWDNQGLPTREWEDLMAQARHISDTAGFYRFAFPREYGGAGHAQQNLFMCAIRHHLAANHGGGLGLANDLQSEHSVVANDPMIIMLHQYGTSTQRSTFIPAALRGDFKATFGLTEQAHGSDATHLETTAQRITFDDGSSGYQINGEKKWQTGAHHATHFLIFARTSGTPGASQGITAFLVPRGMPGLTVDSFQWTMNMPTDHASLTLRDVRVPDDAILGSVDKGLSIAQTFTHENRIRQAASSCGAAQYCIERSIAFAKTRTVFKKPLAVNQAVQWPIVELATQAQMLQLLIFQTAMEMDELVVKCGRRGDNKPWIAIERDLGHKISMCNFYANRLCTEGHPDTRWRRLLQKLSL